MRDGPQWTHSKESAKCRHPKEKKRSTIPEEEMGSQQAQGREAGESLMSPSGTTEHLLSLEMYHIPFKHLHLYRAPGWGFMALMCTQL